MQSTKLMIILPLIFFVTGIHLVSFSQEYQVAEPFGGLKQIDEFICNEMFYPESALNSKTEGTVTIKFIVHGNGQTGNIRIVKSLSPDLDKEALRLFSKILWKGALKMGKPVDSEMEFKIEFDARKYKKQCKKRGFETHSHLETPPDTNTRVYNLSDLDKAPEPVFDNNENYRKFITKNLKYPEAAFRQNIAGDVNLRFIVEPHGFISHLVVEEPLGGGCSQEAIRLAKMLKYSPGIRKTHAVRTWMNLSITFRLPDSQDIHYVPNNPASAF